MLAGRLEKSEDDISLLRSSNYTHDRVDKYLSDV